ncbi:hypothetical protein BDN70DRAFT_639655 [Pholiota conissans]|uniref:Uncharacterized protein n=1 Tax=Pholiota conissans TaxID=109636 RepID=A0A9P5ZBY9_9AGAR|nr:hypothetical protein BDN70DRAFT_639655 [Pholiota conissans]
MSTFAKISAQIQDSFKLVLGDGAARLNVHISDALVALKIVFQSELLWNYLLLMATIWIVTFGAMLCFWIGWVLGRDIYNTYHLGIWFTRRIAVSERRVRMVAKHDSRKRKLSEKTPSPTEVPGSGQEVQSSEEANNGHRGGDAVGTSESDSHLAESISFFETSRFPAIVSHPVSGCTIGDSTPDKAVHMHTLANLNETGAPDNTAPRPPTPTVTNPSESIPASVSVFTVLTDANTTSRKDKRKSATTIICAAMDNLAVSPINTAKGLVDLLTPPATPARTLESEAVGAAI